MPTRGRPRIYKTHAEKIRAYRQRKRERLDAHSAPALPPLPYGPYRVVYADPPWQSFGLNTHAGGQVRVAPYERRPPWTLDTLCALPVKARLTPTAMLFLWVPVPLLVEALSVVTAWGFRYRGVCVWDRMEPFGRSSTDPYVRYSSLAPSVLLLVCARGSALPHNWEAVHGVVRIAATADDAKPESFRQRIEALEGRRLELFASREVPGWDVWPTDEQAETYQSAMGENGVVLEIGAPER